MAENFKDNSSKARDGENDPRAELAGNWAKMAASMVSPNTGQDGKKGGGPAPLPVSALPVPEDQPEPEDAAPQHLDLPRNSKGELTPAQRARLGLDLESPGGDPTAQSAATAPEAPPAGQPPHPPSRRSAPRAQPPAPETQASAAAQTEPTLEAVPEPADEPTPAQRQPDTDFDFRSMEEEIAVEAELKPAAAAEPALRPVENEPRLAPVAEPDGPRLAPVRSTIAPADRPRQVERPPEQQKKREPQREGGGRSDSGDVDEFEHVKRDRNVLTYGVAWTAFCVVVTGIISFTSSMSGDPTASAGPGPLIPGLLSIALGWVIVIVARTLGSGWGALMILPAAVLFVGPYVYKNVWADNVEVAARSYLSPFGKDVAIDVDATSVVSATVNTDNGCFSIDRTRKNYDTEIAVVTYQPQTARQQADFALAPRYAGRITAGGDRSLSRVFTFKNGRAPAIVTTPTQQPLDCAKSYSAPGSGGERLDD